MLKKKTQVTGTVRVDLPPQLASFVQEILAYATFGYKDDETDDKGWDDMLKAANSIDQQFEDVGLYVTNGDIDANDDLKFSAKLRKHYDRCAEELE